MSETEHVKKKIVLNKESDFTPSALVRWLNENYQAKSSGNQFTIRDVQQYTMRGSIPRQYGGKLIEVIEEDAIGIKILRLKSKPSKKS
jgi:hypothetical protein